MVDMGCFWEDIDFPSKAVIILFRNWFVSSLVNSMYVRVFRMNWKKVNCISNYTPFCTRVSYDALLSKSDICIMTMIQVRTFLGPWWYQNLKGTAIGLARLTPARPDRNGTWPVPADFFLRFAVWFPCSCLLNACLVAPEFWRKLEGTFVWTEKRLE